MKELPQERLIVSTQAVAMIERALALTIDYVKQRQAFGKKIIEFQNTQFVLAECKAEATIAKVFLDNCIERHLKAELDTVTASMAKYGIPISSARSPTAACNCSAVTASWTSIRSRVSIATRA